MYLRRFCAIVPNKKVAVLLLNINGYQITKACIESIKTNDYNNYEIILLDNGSDDGSGERLRAEYPDVVYIKMEENTGFAHGCNVCAGKALERNADFLWFLNNDTEICTRTLSELMAAINSRDDIGAVGSMIYYFGTDRKIWFFRSKITWMNSLRFTRPYYLNEKDDGSHEIEESDYLSGCSMLVKRDAWVKTGIFDVKYFSYGEEIDWCIRAYRKGFKFLAVPSSIVWHKVSFSTGGQGSALSSYYRARNNLSMISKNYDGDIKFRSYVCIQYLKAFKNIIMSLFLRRNMSSSLYALKGLNDFNRGVVGKLNNIRGSRELAKI